MITYTLTEEEAQTRRRVYGRIRDRLFKELSERGVDDITAIRKAGDAAHLICETIRTHPTAEFK